MGKRRLCRGLPPSGRTGRHRNCRETGGALMDALTEALRKYPNITDAELEQVGLIRVEHLVPNKEGRGMVVAETLTAIPYELRYPLRNAQAEIPVGKRHMPVAQPQK